MIFDTEQIAFNKIRGKVVELIEHEKFCSVTLQVGHANFRLVNLSCKKIYFEKLLKSIELEDKVVCQFYVSSIKKNERWYNHLSLLSCEKQT